jgi:hypothetical protein
MLKWKDLTKKQQKIITTEAQDQFKYEVEQCHDDYLREPRDEAVKLNIKYLVSYKFDYLQYMYDEVPDNKTLEYIGQEIGSYIFYHCGICSFSF